MLASAKVLPAQAALSRFVTVTVYARVAGSNAPAPWLEGLIAAVGACVTQLVVTLNVALSAVRLTSWNDTPDAASLYDWPSPTAPM